MNKHNQREENCGNSPAAGGGAARSVSFLPAMLGTKEEGGGTRIVAGDRDSDEMTAGDVYI
jgi:hypothetical protein